MKIFDREFSGLSQEDILKRQQLGKTHFVESKTTKTYKEIIFNNIFTFFNLINILLFACLVFVGSYRNTLLEVQPSSGFWHPAAPSPVPDIPEAWHNPPASAKSPPPGSESPHGNSRNPDGC